MQYETDWSTIKFCKTDWFTNKFYVTEAMWMMVPIRQAKVKYNPKYLTLNTGGLFCLNNFNITEDNPGYIQTFRASDTQGNGQHYHNISK